MKSFYTIKWLEQGIVSMIDQRKLPHEVIYNEYTDPAAVAAAIKDMVIRGAPAIGAAAAFGLALVPWHDETNDLNAVINEIARAAELLKAVSYTHLTLPTTPYV